MIVPFTPGSATDILARIITQKLADTWGRPVVVDNRPSAGGIVAFKIVAEALPDGHTLTTTGSNYAGSAALYAGKLPYDPVKDFAGVTQVASTPLILVVAPSLGAKSVKELIALAKAKPGQINFGSSGLGSGPHYGAELFNLTADIKAVHVPYKGSPEAMTDIMAGRIHYLLSPVLSAVPLVRSGRLVALGVTTAQPRAGCRRCRRSRRRASAASNTGAGTACSRPGKTPRPIIKQLAAEIARIIETPDAKERIASQGAVAKIEHARRIRQARARGDRYANQGVESGRGETRVT